MTTFLRNRVRSFASSFLSDATFNQLNYNYLRLKYRKFPRLLNLKEPTRFSEKIVWLKINMRYDNAHTIADKYAVRAIVADAIGSDILIPLYQVINRGGSPDYDTLPDHFVLTPNHASGEIIFVDKANADRRKIQETMNSWFDLDYGKLGHEHHYSEIDPKVVVECDLSKLNGDEEVPDYKFFCCNERVVAIQVDTSRYTRHRRDFFDTSWNKLNFRILFPGNDSAIDPPENLATMIKMAERLARGFVFLRVDFYEIGGKVYFGEMTLHPGGGLEPIWPESYDALLGRELSIDAQVAAPVDSPGQ